LIPQWLTKIPENYANSLTPIAQGGFTKKLIDALPIPQGQRTYYYDESQHGLVLIVHPTGRKTFSLYGKIDGLPPAHLYRSLS
jgi:hypothetical protein